MLKRDKKQAGDSVAITTLLGRDTSIEGTLTFQETIRVDGHIKGRLVSAGGTLIVGENAVLDADIQVAVAIVRGRINGRLDATQRIEIYAPAQVNGDICAPIVAIDSGVHFNGNCKMHPEQPKLLKVEKESKKADPAGLTDLKIAKNL
ncbi:MAG: polymer-forming cytoskeletal protein [Desulfobacteraceae bacterium]|nr:MAG: polymer-forming cytoskeletal protein [Desulfobacteraceae bacterium]